MSALRRLDRFPAATLVVEDVGQREGDRAAFDPGHHPGDHFAECLEMVSAFQSDREAIRAETSGEGRAPLDEVHIPGRRKREGGERVAVVGIDSQAHEDHIRTKLPQDRLDDRVQRRHIGRVAAPGRERDIHRETTALARPGIFRGTRPRIDPVLVRGHVEDRGILGEDVPRPVSVMGVVIQDGDATTRGDLFRGGDRDVVQIAEPAAIVRACMVTGRPDQGDARMAVSDRGPSREEDATHGEQANVECVSMDRGLRIQEALPETPDQFDVRSSMDAPEVRDRRGRRCFDPMKKPFPLQALYDGPKAVRPLHVERRRDMVEEPRIVHDHVRWEAWSRFQGIVRPKLGRTAETVRWTTRTGKGLYASAPSRDLVLETRRILQGDRLRLRPLASTDLRRCVKWFSDPQIIHFLGRNSPVTLPEEERWFRDYERRTDEQIFAIEAEGLHIGNIGLHKIDRVHRKSEVGIVIGEPTFWSKGYGTEAMRTALLYAFGPLSLNKVSLDVLEYNTRAIRIYERLGFNREGVHREDIYKDGRFVHVIRMSILARELREPAVP